MTLFGENKAAVLSLLGWEPLVECPSGVVNWPPVLPALESAALSPGSNGMAPPLCLPSPTLGKWGSVCLLFWRVVRPVYHCHSTEREGQGGALLSNLSFSGLYDHGPHVASTPPWTHTSPSLPFGHRRPLYRLTPAAKICVCAANGGLDRTPN